MSDAMMTPERIYEAVLAARDGDETQMQILLDAIRRGEVQAVLTATRVNLVPVRTGPTVEFAARLRRLHHEADPPITTAQIAQALGSSASSIFRMMSGQALGTWPTVRFFIQVLGGDPEDYVEDYRTAKASRTSS